MSISKQFYLSFLWKYTDLLPFDVPSKTLTSHTDMVVYSESSRSNGEVSAKVDSSLTAPRNRYGGR